MNKEFLEDYEAREKRNFDKFFNDLKAGNFGPHDRYPRPDQLVLKEPYTIAKSGQNIWHQMLARAQYKF